MIGVFGHAGGSGGMGWRGTGWSPCLDKLGANIAGTVGQRSLRPGQSGSRDLFSREDLDNCWLLTQ